MLKQCIRHKSICEMHIAYKLYNKQYTNSFANINNVQLTFVN